MLALPANTTRYDARVAELESLLAETRTHLDATISERDQVRSQLDEQDATWSAERAAYEARITSLTSRCEELASLIAASSSEEPSRCESESGAAILTLQSELEVAQAEKQRLYTEVAALTERLRKREGQLEGDVESVRCRLYEIEDEKEGLAEVSKGRGVSIIRAYLRLSVCASLSFCLFAAK